MPANIGREGLHRLKASGSGGRGEAERWIKERKTPSADAAILPCLPAQRGAAPAVRARLPRQAVGPWSLTTLPEKLAEIDTRIARPAEAKATAPDMSEASDVSSILYPRRVRDPTSAAKQARRGFGLAERAPAARPSRGPQGLRGLPKASNGGILTWNRLHQGDVGQIGGYLGSVG